MNETKPRFSWAALPLLCCAVFDGVNAQAPARLIADLNTQPTKSTLGSFPNDFVRVGSNLLFFASDLSYGTRIWRTDGTVNGTVPVFGIASDYSFSGQLTYAATVGNVLFFRAQTSTHGAELWRSDGTTTGTYMVKDIYPGTKSSFPQQFAVAGRYVLFQAEHPTTGIELWRSDGTATGTVLVKDIRPGNLSGRPFFPSTLGNKVLFTASSTVGVELWISDGTTTGTKLLKDIYPGGASYPRTAAILGNVALFGANTSKGLELWRTDGTTTGTYLVKDIQPGSGTSMRYPWELAVSGGYVYFSADDGKKGAELWRTDGTATGTIMVKDVTAGSNGSEPRELVAYRGGVLFSAQTFFGRQPFFSNGTAAGTVQLGSNALEPQKFTVVPATTPYAVFRANGAAGREMWRTEGTAATTRVVRDIRPGSAGALDKRPNYTFGVAGTTVVFAANDGKVGEEVWHSDGTSNGTQLLKDVEFTPSGSSPRPFAEIDDKLLFTADDGKIGVELWISDGTTKGTHLLREFGPGAASAFILQPVRLGRYIYFLASSLGLSELWRTDGTKAGTVKVASINSSWLIFARLVRAGQQLYFVSGTDLWASDGTSKGTRKVRSFPVSYPYPGAPHQLTEFRGKLWFIAEDNRVISMWQSDGTSAGTVRFSVPGIRQTALEAAGSRLFFVNEHGQTGTELWSTDGTASGTGLVKDIRSGPSSSFPQLLTAVKSKVFFTAGYDRELWVSDGTGTGTFQLRNIHPTRSSKPRTLAPFGNGLLFQAESPSFGFEPWFTDGTSAGTIMLGDLKRGPKSSMDGVGHFTVPGFTVVGSGRTAMFCADDGVVGPEVWSTDGTAKGTRLVADIGTGPVRGRPHGFAMAGTTVLFGAYDAVVGDELFGIPLKALGDSLAKPIGFGCAGSSRKTPALGAIGLPQLGNAKFAMTVQDAAKNMPGMLMVGVGVQRIAFSPSCIRLNGAPVVYVPFTTTGTGSAQINIPIPNNPSLRGAPAVTDAAVLDAGGKLLNIASLTNALMTLAGD